MIGRVQLRGERAKVSCRVLVELKAGQHSGLSVAPCVTGEESGGWVAPSSGTDDEQVAPPECAMSCFSERDHVRRTIDVSVNDYRRSPCGIDHAEIKIARFKMACSEDCLKLAEGAS